MFRKIILLSVFCVLFLAGHASTPDKGIEAKFFGVTGQNITDPSGKPFLIQGINLGNWLNPEGYMFLFTNVNSYRLIDQALKELVGADETNRFWQQFQENYITKADIHYIRQTGMNSIRLPFHYKLFTKEDYMGANNDNRGFELIDRVIGWCKAEGLSVILDMHDAPGGQTGDNIDDSYGYPYLFENKNDQALFCSIWKRIAKHYANETTIIGYDLLNEPIAPYFSNKDEMNKQLEPVYKMATAAIRQVDKNHIVILGGAQWDGNFTVFHDWKFDDKMMYTCHRYWCDTLQANVQDFVNFRSKTNRPIYMGETGENTDVWVDAYRRLLEKNNIGWHFWP
jgi:Endoglucanase